MKQPFEIGLSYLNSNDCSPFNDWFYGKAGIKSAWCATFASFCYDRAGQNLGPIDWQRGYAGVMNAVHHFTAQGLMTEKQKPNDLVFFDWSGHRTAWEHTGIFICDNGDGTFDSIEGNTSIAGSQSHGNGVCRKRRKYELACFAHPKQNIFNPSI